MGDKAAKIFGIRSVSDETREKFHDLASAKGLTPSGLLDFLLKHALTPLTPVNTADLERVNAELTAVNAQLSTDNKTLTDTVNALTEQCGQLTDQVATNAGQVVALAAQLAERVQLSGQQFVYTPSPELGKQMTRAISFDIKKERAKREQKDLPQWFTTKALRFYITNEYDHVLK